MIGVTEQAKQELKKILSTNTEEPEACLRITYDDQGHFDIAIDMEREGDQAIEHEGSKLIVVEKEVADSLPGITIDIESTPEGNSFIINNGSES